MPRVNLGRDPTRERQEATRRIIRRGMAEQGITTQKELANSEKAHEGRHLLGSGNDGEGCKAASPYRIRHRSYSWSEKVKRPARWWKHLTRLQT